MTDRQLGIHMLPPVRHEHAAAVELRVVTDKVGVQVMPHQRPTQLQHMQGRAGVGLQTHGGTPNKVSAVSRFLQHHMLQPGAFGQFNIADLGCQLRRRTLADVLLDQGQLGGLAQLDHIAHMPGEIHRGSDSDEHQLHWHIDLRVGIHTQHHAVAGAGRIDLRKGITDVGVAPRQRESQGLGLGVQRLRERQHTESGRQLVQQGQVGAEFAIDENQPHPVHPGQGPRRRIDNMALGIRIDSGKAALTQRAQCRVLPRFHSRIGQAAGREGGAILFTRLIQPGDAAGRQRRCQQRFHQRQRGRLTHACAPAGCDSPMPR